MNPAAIPIIAAAMAISAILPWAFHMSDTSSGWTLGMVALMVFPAYMLANPSVVLFLAHKKLVVKGSRALKFSIWAPFAIFMLAMIAAVTMMTLGH